LLMRVLRYDAIESKPSMTREAQEEEGDDD
jgi:hypothetical protein